MIIESDLVIAYCKKTDWLKPYADPVFEKLKQGTMAAATSAAVLIELYYVLEDFGLDRSAVLSKQAEVAAIKGLTIFPLTAEVLLAAQSVMRTFKVPGLFDGLYAAATLNQDKDKTVLSTDEVYDRIPGIRRIDPKEFKP